MAKKITKMVKLQVPAGKATPAPPVGPALGQAGVNIMSFVKDFNDRTAKQAGLIIPVEITVYEDRSFTLGKVVTLADLKTAMPSLSVEALRDAAARECTARHISTEEAEKITEFPKEFYIGNNGHLYFIFQQYDIAPYSEGWIMADMGLFPF